LYPLWGSHDQEAESQAFEPAFGIRTANENIPLWYDLVPVPFQNAYERATHFAKHGKDFGAVDEFEYERMADRFLFGQMPAETQQCLRPNGDDRIRFDFISVDFGVANVLPEFVRTFYRVKTVKIARHGGPAGFFAYECARVNL